MRDIYLDLEDSDSGQALAEDEWDVTGELGLLMTSGNAVSSSFTGRINAQHEMTQWSNEYLAELLYKQSEVEQDGETTTEVTAQNLLVAAQLDYKLNQPDNRLFIYGEYEDDRFNGFDYQAAVAAGWSSRLWKQNYNEFKYSVGPGYGVAKRDDGSDDINENGLILRASLDYKHQVTDTTRFRQYLSTEVGRESTRSRSETSIATKVFDEIAMKVALTMSHNSGATDARSLDTETSVTLVYQFF